MNENSVNTVLATHGAFILWFYKASAKMLQNKTKMFKFGDVLDIDKEDLGRGCRA